MVHAPPGQLSISAQFLYRAYSGCHSLQARKPKLLSALQKSEAELRDPGYRLKDGSITVLCDAARRELGRSDINPAIGRTMVPKGFSDIGFAAFFEDSFESALIHLINAQDLGHGKTPIRFLSLPSEDRLIWDDEVPGSFDLVHVVFALLFHAGQQIADGRFPTVKSVHFKHRRPEWFRKFLDRGNDVDPIPCYFNRPSSYIEYHSHVMSASNPRFHPEILQTAQKLINNFRRSPLEHRDLSKLTHEYLFYLLDKSGLSLDAAAMTFGMAERTLRRKLVADGMSFRQLLEKIRKETCRLYFVEGTRSLSEISAKLILA